MILSHTSPFLRIKSKIVPNKEALDLFMPLFTKIVKSIENKALGLAASQTGLNYCLIWVKDLGYLINPVIISHSDKKIFSLESCLSIPNKTYTMIRYKDITVKYMNEDFIENTKQFTEQLSIVLQHEIDHLSGILISDNGLELKND